MTESAVSEETFELRSLAFGAIRLALLGAAVFLIDSLASSTRLVALLGGVLAMEFAAGPLAIKWDESGAKGAVLAKKVLLGLGVGVVLALMAVAPAVMGGVASMSGGSLEWSSIGLALVVAFAQATRDELLFRGLPLKWLEGRLSDRLALGFVSLLGAVPVLAVTGVTIPGILITLFTSIIFSLLWRLGRGMYLVWGAHAGWLFMMSSGLRGSFADVQMRQGALVPVAMAQGSGAWGAALGVAVGMVLVGAVFRRQMPTQ